MCSSHPIHSQSEVFDNSKVQTFGLRAATMSATLERLIQKDTPPEFRREEDTAAFPYVSLKRASRTVAASIAGMAMNGGDFPSVAQLETRRLGSEIQE